MFFGHFAFSYLLAGLFPQIPISLLYIGAAWIDLFHGLFICFGITITEPNPKSGPYLFQDLIYADWDHSLLMATIWSILFGFLCGMYFYFPSQQALPKGKTQPKLDFPRLKYGFICFLSAFIHWFFDLPVHNYDLALYPGSSIHFGWGWWDRFGAWSWLIEVLLSWGLCFGGSIAFSKLVRDDRTNWATTRLSTIHLHVPFITIVFPLILNPYYPVTLLTSSSPFHSKYIDGMSVIGGYAFAIWVMLKQVNYDWYHK